MTENRTYLSEGKFKFRYQKDPSFKALIDSGIGLELSGSGYCWAACIDMALSPFVSDELRSQILIDSIKNNRFTTETFNSDGEIATNKLGDFVNVLNENLTKQQLAAGLDLIENPRFEDYHLELQKGRTIIYAIGDATGGHMMVMEKVYQDGNKYIYSVWNPETSNPTEAKQYFDNFHLYGRQQYADIKIFPFIISVGE